MVGSLLSAERFDVVVEGAGIVGLAIARRLLLERPDLSLLVLEKEDRVATHQSSRNSGVIPGGDLVPRDRETRRRRDRGGAATAAVGLRTRRRFVRPGAESR